MRPGLCLDRLGEWAILSMDREVTINREVKNARSLYALNRLKVVDPGGLRRIVSRCEVEVHGAMPPGMQITAPKISLFCEQPNPPTLTSLQLVYWDVSLNRLDIQGLPGLLKIGGSPLKPEQRDLFSTVFEVPRPRTTLPPKATQTTEDADISCWHLIAMGILDQFYIKDFLLSTHTVPETTVFEDLNESMGFPDEMHFYGAEKLGIAGLGTTELRAIAAFRNPLEICGILRLPLFSGYSFDKRLVSPVLRSFIHESILECARYNRAAGH